MISSEDRLRGESIPEQNPGTGPGFQGSSRKISEANIDYNPNQGDPNKVTTFFTKVNESFMFRDQSDL